MEAVREFDPDVVGLSVLLTCCFHSLEDTVRAIRLARGGSDRPQILISGAQVTSVVKDCFKADLYAPTVFDTVRLCERFCQAAARSAA